MDKDKTTILEDSESNQEKKEPKSEEKKTLLETQIQSQSSQNVEEKKPTLLYLVIGTLLVAIIVMGYFLFFTDKGKNKVSGLNQIRQQQELTQQVQEMESTIKENEDIIFSNAEEYKEKSGEEALGINILNLNEDEKKLLKEKIKNEQDISKKALLKEILEKNNEIQELKAKITEIEALLPKPHIVVKGENHYQIAMDFLINEKGLDKKKAMNLVERTAVYDQLVPGFRVWNFYTGDAYGTSVTQGTANISPNTLIRRAKKELVDARDEAISQRDQLTEDIKLLEDKRAKLIGHLDSLSQEKENLIDQVGDLNFQVNSLAFIVDSYGNLKKNGIIKGAALFRSAKLQDVSPENFSKTIDLRSQNQINFSATELGLGKIKKIILYPKFYKEGSDFKIEISDDKQNAIITILTTNKFKNERIVISVR